MVDSQASSEALGECQSSEDFELRSLITLDSRIHNDVNIELSDQSQLTASSTETLHQSSSPERVDSASQCPVQSNEDAQSSSAPKEIKHSSAVQRMGTYSLFILAATTILILAVHSFLAFLWTAPHEHGFWRLVIVNGWAGGAATVSSVMLRTAVDLQAGVAVAMLAAILLETGYLLLVDTAQVSY